MRFDVFLSHHSADKPAVERLALKLRSIGIEAFLDKWHLVPGEPWHEAVEKALKQSRTCAVFLGPHGPGPWETEEMYLALDRRVRDTSFRVIPVLLPGTSIPEPGNLPSFLSRSVWVDFRDGVEDENALRRLKCGIQNIEPGPPTKVMEAQGVCPFRGLEPFYTEHADFFCGREALTQHLVEAIRETAGSMPSKKTRFLAVVGPSGTGKSSVVRAGLIPALQDGAIPGSANWISLILKPGSNPLEELALHIVRLLGNTGNAVYGFLDLQDRLRSDSRTLHAALRLVPAENQFDPRLLIIVDQFEELFTLTQPERERTSFLNNLLYASEVRQGQATVMVVLRADFYSKAAQYPDLANRMAAHQLIVPPMVESEIRQAIELPSKRSGLSLDDGLIETIVRDLREQTGALPLLQHTLLRLWEEGDGRLTHSAYKDIGRVDGALARWAEEVYEKLSRNQRPIARSLFLCLVQPGEDTQDTRRRARLSELLATTGNELEAKSVLEDLIKSRLLVADRDAISDESLVDISHEALLTGWPRLGGWIKESREAMITRSRFRFRAREWLRLNRDQGSLLRGAALSEMEEWYQEHRDGMTSSQAEYFCESIKQRFRDRRDKTELERFRAGLGELQEEQTQWGEIWGVDFQTSYPLPIILSAQNEGVSRQESPGIATSPSEEFRNGKATFSISASPRFALTQLTRLAQRRADASNWLRRVLENNLERLARGALEVAAETGDPIGRVLAEVVRRKSSVDLADQLMQLCNETDPSLPVPWRELAFEATRISFMARRSALGTEPTMEDLAELARIAVSLSNRSHELGHLEDGLQVALEAIEIQRRLVADRPKIYLPDLATSLTNLSIRHAVLGKWQEALLAIHEAVDIRRRLASEEPEANLDLASSLDNLGIILSELDHPMEALEANREAVEIRRRQVKDRPGLLSQFAGSLANLAGRFNDLGRNSDALAVMWESVEIRRRLAGVRPETFLPDLARSLHNLGIVLSASGDDEQAFEVTREAAEIRRRLVWERPEAFRPDLARTLHSLGLRLNALGRQEEALSATSEAVDIRRQLETERPGSARAELADSLHQMGSELSALGQQPEALSALNEAIELRRSLVEEQPDDSLSDLAESLSRLSVSLTVLERWEEALDAAAGAVRALASLYERQPDSLGDDMADMVENYQELAKAVGREPDRKLLAPIFAGLESRRSEAEQ